MIDFRMDQETLDKVNALTVDKEMTITEKTGEKSGVLYLYGIKIGRQNFFPLHRLASRYVPCCVYNATTILLKLTLIFLILNP